MPETDSPRLVVIDAQRIFADPDSDWGSPFFDAAMSNIARLARAAGPEHTILTRWVPTADRTTSWGDYFRAWPFADVGQEDPLYQLVDAARALSAHATVDLPTFGKWGPELAAAVGGHSPIWLTGVSTDCCVIATALAAADAGRHVFVVTDACAASTLADGEAAVQIMGLFTPQITLVTTDELLS